MNANRRPAAKPPESEPPHQPFTPAPVRTEQIDHSFTLQAIVGLEKSVAELGIHMQGVKTTLEGVKSKVDDLVAWKNRILGGAAMLALAIAAISFLAGKASDYVTFKMPAPVSAPVAPPPPK